MARQLTPRQDRFIGGVVSGLTYSEAYRQAGYKVENYTATVIAKKSSQLANRVDIRGIIDRRKKKLAEKAIWSREEALRELANIAKADIKDYLAFRTEKTVVAVDKDTGMPVVDYAHIIDMMDSEDVDGRVIQEISISKDGTLKFKLHDKARAIEMANKMCGYNEPQKVEVSGTMSIEQLLSKAEGSEF